MRSQQYFVLVVSLVIALSALDASPERLEERANERSRGGGRQNVDDVERRENRRQLRRLNRERERRKERRISESEPVSSAPEDLTNIPSQVPTSQLSNQNSHVQPPSDHAHEISMSGSRQSVQENIQDSSHPRHAVRNRADVDGVTSGLAEAVRGASAGSSERMLRSRIRRKELRKYMLMLMLTEQLHIPPEGTPPMAADNVTEFDLLDLHEILPSSGGSGGTQRTFTPRFLPCTCRKPGRADDSWWEPGHMRLFFDVVKGQVKDSPHSNLTSANLRLYKRPVNTPHDVRVSAQEEELEQQDSALRVTVYEYLKPSKEGRPEKTNILSAMAIEKSYAGRMRLDMRTALRRWSEQPRRNHGVLVTVEDSDGRAIDPSTVFSTRDCNSRESQLGLSSDFSIPTLEIVQEEFPKREVSRIRRVEIPEIQDEEEVRIRREALNESTLRRNRNRSRRRRQHCGMTETTLIFSELGMDWIIQPESFVFRTCQGTCTKLPKSKAVKRRYGKYLDKYREEQEECCVPTEMRPLSVIHMDEHSKVHISILPDFIITACGCGS